MHLLITYNTESKSDHHDPVFSEFTYGDVKAKARRLRKLRPGDHIFFHTKIGDAKFITAYFVVDRFLDTADACKDPAILAKFNNPHIVEGASGLRPRAGEDDVIVFGNPSESRVLTIPIPFDKELAEKLKSSLAIRFPSGNTELQSIGYSTRSFRQLTDKDVTILLSTAAELEKDSVNNNSSSSYVSGVRDYFNELATGKDWLLSRGDKTLTLEFMPIYRDEVTNRFGIRAQFWMEEPSGGTATLKFEFAGGIDHLSLREALAVDFRRLLFADPIPFLLVSKGSTAARMHLAVPMSQDDQAKILEFYSLVRKLIGNWRDTNLLHVLETHGVLPDHFVDQFLITQEAIQQVEQRTVFGQVFVRSPEVRRRVLVRAQGKCEWCSQPGFAMMDGRIFLETHHVIPLSEGGSDTEVNVVALCPNHHREAHHGASCSGMRNTFLSQLSAL